MLLPTPSQEVARVWLKVKLILLCWWHARECMVTSMLQFSAYICHDQHLQIAASREWRNEQISASISAYTGV